MKGVGSSAVHCTLGLLFTSLPSPTPIKPSCSPAPQQGGWRRVPAGYRIGLQLFPLSLVPLGTQPQGTVLHQFCPLSLPLKDHCPGLSKQQPLSPSLISSQHRALHLCHISRGCRHGVKALNHEHPSHLGSKSLVCSQQPRSHKTQYIIFKSKDTKKYKTWAPLWVKMPLRQRVASLHTEGW